MRAFIVEGRMEKLIVEKLCPGNPVRLLGVNGDHVEIETIARFAAVQLELLVNRYNPVHIIFDREKRLIACEEIAKELSSRLVDRGFDIAQIRIAVPDRTTENWFLPFLQHTGSLNADLRCNAECEGKDGKSVVKALFRGLKRSYVETIDGVRLFCSVKPSQLVMVSESFLRFSEQLDPTCWWMRN